MYAIRHCLIAWLVVVSVMLAACTGEGTSSNGALFITTTPPDAEVLVNGEPKGHSPLTVRELEPGDYDVVLRKDGYQDAQVIASVKSRQIANVTLSLQTERAPRTHRFAFVSKRDGAFDIWTADQSGADAQRWTSLRWQHAPLQVVLAPDASNFAVSVEVPRGVATYIISAPHRSGETALADAHSVGSEIFRALQWTPDSRSVLLKNLASQTLWLGNLKGDLTQVPIPNVPRGVLTAAVAPDGKAIAYVDDDKTWLVAPDGTGRQELAQNGSEGNTFLRYSRDGRRIVHVRVQKPNAYNAGELWIMNANGSLPRRLSLSGSQDFEPVWARDNNRVVFVHRENVQDANADQDPTRLVSNLWVLDLALQSLRSLTAFNGKRVRQPSIALDDQTITFVSSDTGSDEIWSVDLRGGDPHPLTLDRASAEFPLWLW